MHIAYHTCARRTLSHTQKLNHCAAGLVTDRLPGLGENYRQAVPLPSYDPQPSSEEVSQDLEKGHRYVDAPEHKLQDAGVWLLVPFLCRFVWGRICSLCLWKRSEYIFCVACCAYMDLYSESRVLYDGCEHRRSMLPLTRKYSCT
jgi:hypothetical protein